MHDVAAEGEAQPRAGQVRVEVVVVARSLVEADRANRGTEARLELHPPVAAILRHRRRTNPGRPDPAARQRTVPSGRRWRLPATYAPFRGSTWPSRSRDSWCCSRRSRRPFRWRTSAWSGAKTTALSGSPGPGRCCGCPRVADRSHSCRSDSCIRREDPGLGVSVNCMPALPPCREKRESVVGRLAVLVVVAGGEAGTLREPV